MSLICKSTDSSESLLHLLCTTREIPYVIHVQKNLLTRPYTIIPRGDNQLLRLQLQSLGLDRMQHHHHRWLFFTDDDTRFTY